LLEADFAAGILQEWIPLDAVEWLHHRWLLDTKGRDIMFQGKPLSWRKSVKYEAIIDMPQRLPDVAWN